MSKHLIILVIFFSFFTISIATATEIEIEPNLNLTAFICGNSVHLRSEPSMTSSTLGLLNLNTMVNILESSENWVKVQLPDGRTGWVFKTYLSSTSESDISSSPIKQLTAFAQSFLDVPYRYGGASPNGFDCSGFTMYVYSHFGYKLPHSAASQMQLGILVNKEDLQEGDLVFFRTLNAKSVNHVGIYLNNYQFIHASSGYGAVRISPLNTGYYASRYLGGRRMIISK